MRMIAISALSLLSILLIPPADSTRPRPVFAADTESDYRAVLEVGGAGELAQRGGATRGGATVAVEMTPIEHWLELESGVTELWKGPSRELSIDLLFKKPWQWSRSVEFMAGLGPQVSWASGGGEHGTSVSTEVIADFMFWGSKNLGLYLEPGFATTGFHGEQSFAIAAGLIVGLR
jgi:hypothetical protein